MGEDWADERGIYEMVLFANPAHNRTSTASYHGHTLLNFGTRIVYQHLHPMERSKFPKKPLYRLLDTLRPGDTVEFRVLWRREAGDDATIPDLPNEWQAIRSHVCNSVFVFVLIF